MPDLGGLDLGGIDLEGPGTIAAILAMGAVTYSIRAGGFWLMGHVPLTARVRRMLEALPGTVVVATRGAAQPCAGGGPFRHSATLIWRNAPQATRTPLGDIP